MPRKPTVFNCFDADGTPFVINCPDPVRAIRQELVDRGILEEKQSTEEAKIKVEVSIGATNNSTPMSIFSVLNQNGERIFTLQHRFVAIT